jgi:hypothetical protein
MTDDDPLPALRTELDRLEQPVYGHRLQGAWLGMALGRISSLRKQIAILEQARQRAAEGTPIATPTHLSTRSR